MHTLEHKVSSASAAALAVINALAGMGIVLPDYIDGQGIALLDAVILAIAALVYYIKGKRSETTP